MRKTILLGLVFMFLLSFSVFASVEIFSAVGASGAVRWSEDGKTWTTSGTAGSTQLYGVVWSPELELFSTVGVNGAVRWSEDGKSWTTTGTAGSTTLFGVAYSPELELFVAVGHSGAVRWSEDGKSWTTTGTAGSSALYSIAYSPELEIFVAVGHSGNVRWSEDGKSWTTTGTAGSTRLFGVTWSPELELFSAVGDNGAVRWSEDGKSWTTTGTAGSAQLLGVAYSPELEIFAAVGASGNVRWSEDGKSWTNSGTAGSTTLRSVAWSPKLELFVAVGHSGAVRWSEDGKSWTTTGTAGSADLLGVVWSFSPTDFTITAKDTYTNTSINTFNATITNSTDTIILSTTNGTIIWEYGDEDLLDITIRATNYFDRTYTDYNTTEKLEARLHNLVVTAKNSESGNSINNFFIIYNETTFSTNNGTLRTNLNYPSSEGGLFSFEVGATDYVNQNITNHQSNQTLEVSLFPANSLTINIFDAKTLDPILDDFPYTLEGTKDFYTTGNVTNGSLVIQELEADDYELTFNKVGEYYPQTFYLRLQEGEAISIDAYFYDINTTLYSSVITIVDPNSQPIEAALVSIQERIQGNYRTISQKYTDSTGKVAFLLRPDADHKIIIEKTGFTTREYEIRPISDPYAVTLRINPELSYNYETAYDNVFFSYLPKIKQLNLSEHIFNLSLSSPNGELQYFGITTIYATTNITGSPSGGTAVLTADLTNHTSSTLSVRYFFKSIGRQEYSFTIVYPVSNIKPSSTSIIGIKEDSIFQEMSPLLKFIIIISTTIFLLFIGIEFGVPIQGAGIVFTLVLVGAWLIGWIPILIPLVIGILTIGSFFWGNE